jgi:uncharacterized protein (TIGR00251 family)
LGGDRKFTLHDGKIGAAITVRVTPRMAKDQIYDILDDGTIKIRLTAPPVAGKANKALIRYLAETLEIPTSWIEIIAGQNSHDKLISILNLDSEEVQKRILKHLDQ